MNALLQKSKLGSLTGSGHDEFDVFILLLVAPFIGSTERQCHYESKIHPTIQLLLITSKSH